MNMNVSAFLKLMAALSIAYLKKFANASCLQTLIQDFRAASPKLTCIEATDCAGGSIIEEIKVCLDTCPSNTTTETNPNWPYKKCICSSARISSDFRICSKTCPNKEVAQEDSKLCLTSYQDCSTMLTQDRTMCGPNVCLENQYFNIYNGQNVCTCKKLDFLDLKTKECMDTCPEDQITNFQYQVCLVTDADCKMVMSSDYKTCGLHEVCKQYEYIIPASGNKIYGICSPCPDASPLAQYDNQSCFSCSPNISDLTTGKCLEYASWCAGSGIISSDGERCSKTCNLGEYISQEEGYLQCRDMSECPFVDKRIFLEICLKSYEDCAVGFVSADRRSCLISCPLGQQITTETLLIPQEFKYKKCVDQISKILLISVGFAVFTILSSFLLCQGMIRAKTDWQEFKYIRVQYPAIIEDEENEF